MGLRIQGVLARGILVAAAMLPITVWSAVPGPMLLDLQSGHAPAIQQQVDAVRRADGAYAYQWTVHRPGCCESSGELTVDRELGLHLSFVLGNGTSGPRDYRASFSIPVPEGTRLPTQIAGLLTGTVSGSGQERDPLLTSVGSSPIFTALLDGTPVATSLGPPFVLTGAARTLALPARSFGGRTTDTGGGSMTRAVGLRLHFQLGPGATVRLVTRWHVVPPPFPVAALLVGIALLCLLVLVRQRRQSRRVLAARPAPAGRLR